MRILDPIWPLCRFGLWAGPVVDGRFAIPKTHQRFKQERVMTCGAYLTRTPHLRRLLTEEQGEVAVALLELSFIIVFQLLFHWPCKAIRLRHRHAEIAKPEI